MLARRSDLWGMWLVFHVWGGIITSGAVYVLFPNLFTFILAVMLIGSRQHGMSVLAHDAAHGVLFKTKAVNEWVGKYLLAAPYGGDMLAYRKYHLKHHRFTQSEDDPDLPLSSKFPVKPNSLRRKFFRDLTGQTFLRIRIASLKMRKGNEHFKIEGSDAFQKTSPWPSLIANGLMLTCLSAIGLWWAYFVLWVLPLATWFFAVLRLRNIAEHALTTNDDNPLTHARTIRTNWLERVFFSPYWVNYHVEHHTYMFVPCYRLPALHRKMINAGHGREMEIQNGYFNILKLATV